MELPGWISEILHGDQLFAVEHRKEHETRIDSPIAKGAIARLLAENNRARPAIPLGATFLYTLVGWQAPEVLKNRGRGPKPGTVRKVNCCNTPI